MPLEGFKSVTVSEEAYSQARQLTLLGLEENIGKAFASAIKEYVERRQELIKELRSAREKWSKKVKVDKRWRLWRCVQGSDGHRCVETREEIAWLELKGFKAKIWAPRSEHKTSGHTHIVVLCTFNELCKLSGIDEYMKRERDE